MKQVALVTGANRGIGFEVARQLGKQGYQVILGCRGIKKAEEAAERLKSERIDALPLNLDVAESSSIRAAFEWIGAKIGRLDVLVNNAGIFPETEGSSILTASLEPVRQAFETNTLGPLQISRQAVSLMKKNGSGRIVNVSSGMGQLAEMNGGYPAYRLSKTALNAVTRMFADELQGAGILVNSVCPGWVKTDMGGPNAERPVEKGAETVVWLATLPDGGPTGGFFRDKEKIEW
jgi:NAD(P)-dependent dehydrogenase (short-subunit alcohol dehydrogenase family)